MDGYNDLHLIDINEQAKIRKVSFFTTGGDPGISFLGGGDTTMLEIKGKEQKNFTHPIEKNLKILIYNRKM